MTRFSLLYVLLLASSLFLLAACNSANETTKESTKEANSVEVKDSSEEEVDATSEDVNENVGDTEDYTLPLWESKTLEVQHITDFETNRVIDVFADEDFIYILLSDNNKYYLSVSEGEKIVNKDIPLAIKTMPEQKSQTVSFSRGKIYNKVTYNSHKSDEKKDYLSDDEGLYIEYLSFNKDGLVPEDSIVVYDGDRFLDSVWGVGSLNTSQGLATLKYNKVSDGNGGIYNSTEKIEYELVLIDDPSKSFIINDKLGILKDSRLFFYDVENSLLYYSLTYKNGLFVMDNNTGEPVYENGEDKNLWDFEIHDFFYDAGESTFTISYITDTLLPSIIKVDKNFNSKSEVFTETATHEGDFQSYLTSPNSSIVWSEFEFERKKAVRASVMNLEKLE